MKSFVAVCVFVAIISSTVGRSRPVSTDIKQSKSYYYDDYYNYYYDGNYYDSGPWSYVDYYEDYYDDNYYSYSYRDNYNYHDADDYGRPTDQSDHYYPNWEYSIDDYYNYGGDDESEEGSTGPWGTTEHPAFALVQYESSLVCYGTVIDNDWVLTSASCTHQVAPSKLAVKVGKKGKPISVEKVVEHPKFDQKTLKNNIALLKLAHPIPPRPAAKTARRPHRPHPKRSPKPKRAAGAGLIAVNANDKNHPETKLLKAAISNSCKSLQNAKDHSEFCVKVVGHSPHAKSCHGNVGTPFVVNHKVRGIYSTGDACKSGAVFTNLRAHRDFITKVTHKTHKPHKAHPKSTHQ